MKVWTENDYNSLEACIMCYPTNLPYQKNPDPSIQVDINLANIQFNALLDAIIGHGAKVHFMPLNGSPEQVFTRDIGFVIDDILFISNMYSSTRKSEIDGLKELARQYQLKTHIMKNHVEGGDVIFDNAVIFIGQGKRTNALAADEIQGVLNQHQKTHKLVKVAFDMTKIHLDCVFNILDEHTCIISSGVYEPKAVTKYFDNVIDIPDRDMPDLASNIVQLSKHHYLCSSENFTEILKSYGYQVTFIDYSEIIKFDGSLGCCVLPIERQKSMGSH